MFLQQLRLGVIASSPLPTPASKRALGAAEANQELLVLTASSTLSENTSRNSVIYSSATQGTPWHSQRPTPDPSFLTPHTKSIH